MNADDARSFLLDQLRTIRGDQVRVYEDLTAEIAPPGVLVSVPSLSWNGMYVEPTDATFQVIYCVKFDSRAADRLMAGVKLISEAITGPDFVITSAEPTTWADGTNSGLPAYRFTVSVSLS